VFIPAVKYDQQQIERAIKSVEEQFPDSIEHIRYSVGEDWTHDPALFFRVLLKGRINSEDLCDPAGRRSFFLLTSRISDTLRHIFSPDEVPLQPYFAFRSVSEQETVRDPEWD